MTRLGLALGALVVLPATGLAGPCDNGLADGYACDGVDLLGRLPLAGLSSAPDRGNDIWGFRDLNTERDYALIGLGNGLAVVDVTDPATPVEVGTIPGQLTTWRDVKVLQYADAATGRFRAYAYLTADGASDGLLVVDLSGLPNAVRLVGRRTSETRAHNVYIANLDPETHLPLAGLTPVLYTAGSNLDGGVARAYSLADPENPALIGAVPAGGHSHDLASAVLRDARAGQCPNATGACVLLADANEDDLQLWDITDPANALLLSTTLYPTLGFVHSATFTEDARFLVVQDELDEINFNLPTRQRIFDLANLGQPELAATWEGSGPATDHNGFVRAGRLYLSNYSRGLTVVNLGDPRQPFEAGFLDTRPEDDATGFDGAWGVYPWLPSGIIAVSDVQRGLFLLADRGLAAPADVIAARPVSGGEEGEVVSVPVTRSGGAGAVAVSWTLAPASAAPGDFTAASGRLAWADGETGAREIAVALTPDGDIEGVERLFLRLYAPEGGVAVAAPQSATVFVADAGAPSTLGFVAADLEVTEDAGRLVAVVRRSGGVRGAASVRYRALAGTATPGVDYTMIPDGLLQWPDGDATSRSLVIAVLGDARVEADESLSVELYDAQGASLDASPVLGVTLLDTTPPPPPAAGGGGSGGGSGGGGGAGWLLPALLWMARPRRLARPTAG